MNYLLTAIFVLMLGSCTKENQAADEELRTTRLTGEKYPERQEVFELDLKQYAVLNSVEDLENQKSELMEQIEAGNEELLPELESVVGELRTNYSALGNILESTCTVLRLRFAVLTEQLEEGDLEALDELSDIEGKLEKCGIDVGNYLFEIFEGHPVIYAAVIGSRCSPGHEWKCKNIMNQGKLLINVEEELAERTEARFKTADGEVISTGRMVGVHDDLEGILQIELELHQIDEGIVEISNGNGYFEVPIEVQ